MSQENDLSPEIKDQSENICEENKALHSFVYSMAVSSQYIFGLAVIGTGIIAVILLVYGFILSIVEAYSVITNFAFQIHQVKLFLGVSIQIIDVFLVGTVFYLISLGLYELFIAKAPLPGWVQIKNLDDLKDKLLGLTVIALSVIFLGNALEMKTQVSFMEIGISIGIIIAAISFYKWAKH